MSEVQEQLKKYEKENFRITSYESLKRNSDFQIFREDIESKIEFLRDLLEGNEEKTDFVKGQIAALRGLLSLFDLTLSRKEEVQKTIKELENSL